MEIKPTEKGFWANLKPIQQNQTTSPPPDSEEQKQGMEGDRLDLSQKPANEVVPAAIDQLQKANKVAKVLTPTIEEAEKLAKTAAASDAVAELAKPLDSRRIDLKEAIVQGDVSKIIKEASGTTHVAKAAGLYGNVIEGGLAKKAQKALDTLQDPNADGADKAIASLDAATSAIDTYEYSAKLAQSAANFSKEIGNAKDLASVAAKVKAATRTEVHSLFVAGPKSVIAGLKGVEGGIADVVTQTGLRRASAFATGVNIALAASDVLHAEQVLKSDASALQKNLAMATAVGSMIAATNIPGLSQIGAGLSFLTGIAEGFTANSEEKTPEKPPSPISWSTTG